MSAVWAALSCGAAGWLLLPLRPDASCLGDRGLGSKSLGSNSLGSNNLGSNAPVPESTPGWHVATASVAALSAGLLAGAGPLSTAVIALVVGGAALRLLRRSAGAPGRRAHEVGVAELPHLVGLLAAGLRAGAAPPAALEEACRALPGPAADLVADVRPRLVWGADPAQVWAELASDPVLGPLGRSLSRAHETGASVVDSIDSLATQLASEGRDAVEDRARAVGVRAALPLGLCLLPAFLLLGIVPSIAVLISQLALG